MPATNNQDTAPHQVHARQPGCSTGLRPELAAFFALSTREQAPRRLAIEHGVLAELRRRHGSG